jgi:hypothetical protein
MRYQDQVNPLDRQSSFLDVFLPKVAVSCRRFAVTSTLQ